MGVLLDLCETELRLLSLMWYEIAEWVERTALAKVTSCGWAVEKIGKISEPCAETARNLCTMIQYSVN